MNKSVIDVGGSVREGEELNLENLTPWLKKTLPHLKGEPKVTQYSGGASNWTYRIEFDNDDLILRRPPEGKKAKGAHDMSREYKIQDGISKAFPYLPEMCAYTDDASIIGDEFYVMKRLEGVIPRRNFPRDLNIDPETANTLCRNAIDALVNLHQIDIQKNKLEWVGAGEGYARRQIEGWNKRFADARTWNVPKGTKIMNWLEANIPTDEKICITHNDFRLDNLVLNPDDPSEIMGILDWELATLGDPLMDLGNMLAYWVENGEGFMAQQMRRQPSHLKGMMTRDEIIAYYGEKTGVNVDNFAFYEVYGLFRLSAIVQQIYYRYHHKQTDNPSFKNFWLAVHYLHHRCRKIIKKAK